MRKRYFQIDGELFEVTADYTAPPRGGGASGDSALWNDRIYQDCNDPRFSSRTQHRDYMRRNGLTTVDDFKDHWKRAEAKRLEYRTTGRDPTRLQHIIDAVHKLESRHG